MATCQVRLARENSQRLEAKLRLDAPWGQTWPILMGQNLLFRYSNSFQISQMLLLIYLHLAVQKIWSISFCKYSRSHGGYGYSTYTFWGIQL